MPAKRPTQTRSKRLATPVQAFSEPILEEVQVRIEFVLPDWRRLPPSKPQNEIETRAWKVLSDEIEPICQNAVTAPAGFLSLDIETKFDLNTPIGFHPDFGPSLAEQISLALPPFFEAGPRLSYPLALAGGKDLEATRVFANFSHQTIGDKDVAQSHLLVHIDRVEAVDEDGTPSTRIDSVKQEPDNPQIADTPTLVTDSRKALLDALLATVSQDVGYELESAKLLELNNETRLRIADRLGRALDKHLLNQTQDNIHQKRFITHAVNVELKKFNLAIRFEKDGEVFPAILVVHVDKRTPKGRFRLEYKTSDGKSHRALYEEKVPSLNLMPDATRSDGFSKKWADRVNQDEEAIRRT